MRRGAVVGLVLVTLLATDPRPGAVGFPRSPAGAGAFTLSTMLRSGDPVIGGGTFSFCPSCEADLAGIHALNDAGQVLISGFLVDDCVESVFIAANRTGTQVASFCQTTPFGKFSLFARGDINNSGQVALNMGPLVNNNIIDMLLVSSQGQLTQAVVDGELVPTGQIFGYFGFSEPSINNSGDLAFTACFQDAAGNFNGDGVFAYSSAALRKVAITGDPSPGGGTIVIGFVPPTPAFINDIGDVLFFAGDIPAPDAVERSGMFVGKADGTLEKIQLGGDTMPNGSMIAANSLGAGTINNQGHVAFGVNLIGRPKDGIFLYSAGEISTVLLGGSPSPIGGAFAERIPGPGDNVIKINDNDAIALEAGVSAGGKSTLGLFLASTKTIVKVAAVGDTLPTGEKIGGIDAFSLNNLGQVAFFAHSNDSEFHAIGLYLATPTTPAVTSLTTKGSGDNLRLIVEGTGFITNDSTILINGQPVATTYPAQFHQNGGTTTRLISRDPQLAQLLVPGQAVQVIVTNSLTALQSASMRFVP